MCGRFALYSPSDRLQAELETHGLGTCSDGWTCVRDQNGSPTSLWTRPPLITTSDLEQFAAGLRGIRGSKMFEQAVNCVSGVTASPLEAQLSMLLWMSCDLGGWGYRNFENNYRIVLSNNAKTLIDTDHAEVDMRVLSPDGTKEWMIECKQGHPRSSWRRDQRLAARHRPPNDGAQRNYGHQRPTFRL